MLELHMQITSFRASKNTNDVLVQTKQMEENARPRMLKSFFSVRESC